MSHKVPAHREHFLPPDQPPRNSVAFSGDAEIWEFVGEPSRAGLAAGQGESHRLIHLGVKGHDSFEERVCAVLASEEIPNATFRVDEIEICGMVHDDLVSFLLNQKEGSKIPRDGLQVFLLTRQTSGRYLKRSEVWSEDIRRIALGIDGNKQDFGLLFRRDGQPLINLLQLRHRCRTVIRTMGVAKEDKPYGSRVGPVMVFLPFGVG